MRFSRARGPGPSPPRRWRPRVSRLGTRALALLLSGLLGATADGEEPEPGIRVRPADPRPREIRPQEILTVPFRATNPSLEARELVEQIQAPPGWRLLAEPGTFRLSPGASEIRLLSVYVPVTTLAGRYPLLYRVEDSRQRGVADQAPIEVTVRPVLQLEVRPETVPERVIAGKTYTAVLQVLSQIGRAHV